MLIYQKKGTEGWFIQLNHDYGFNVTYTAAKKEEAREILGPFAEYPIIGKKFWSTKSKVYFVDILSPDKVILTTIIIGDGGRESTVKNSLKFIYRSKPSRSDLLIPIDNPLPTNKELTSITQEAYVWKEGEISPIPPIKRVEKTPENGGYYDPYVYPDMYVPSTFESIYLWVMDGIGEFLIQHVFALFLISTCLWVGCIAYIHMTTRFSNTFETIFGTSFLVSMITGFLSMLIGALWCAYHIKISIEA